MLYDIVWIMVVFVQDSVFVVFVCMIGEDVEWCNGWLVVDVLFVVLEIFELLLGDLVFYKVIDGYECLFVGNFVFDLFVWYGIELMLYDMLFDGVLLCVVVYDCQLYDEGQVEMVIVVVVKMMCLYGVMVVMIWWLQFVCLFLMLVFVVVFVYFGFIFELCLLMKLKDDVVDCGLMEFELICLEWL